MFRACFSMALLTLSLYAVFAAWAETSKVLVSEQHGTAGEASYGILILAAVAVPLALSLLGSLVHSVPVMLAEWYEENRAWLTATGLGAVLLFVFYWL